MSNENLSGLRSALAAVMKQKNQDALKPEEKPYAKKSEPVMKEKFEQKKEEPKQPHGPKEISERDLKNIFGSEE